MSVLNNTVHAAFGAIQVSKEKAEAVVDDLIKKGELDKSRRKEAILELLQQAEKVTEEIRTRMGNATSKIDTSMVNAIDGLKEDLSFAKRSDFATLEKRVNDLAKTMDDIKRKLGT
jgi:polyhydroxyalkanoate synthesis regulator phasin